MNGYDDHSFKVRSSRVVYAIPKTMLPTAPKHSSQCLFWAVDGIRTRERRANCNSLVGSAVKQIYNRNRAKADELRGSHWIIEMFSYSDPLGLSVQQAELV